MTLNKLHKLFPELEKYNVQVFEDVDNEHLMLSLETIKSKWHIYQSKPIKGIHIIPNRLTGKVNMYIDL